MNPRTSHWVGALLAMAAMGAAGCSLPLPQAQNDPTRTYVLSVPAGETAAAPSSDAPVLRLRPVEIASYLRARPMIVRRGENEIDFREFARWGEPLEQGIARVLREALLERGAASSVQVIGSHTEEADAKYELSVRVLSCEGGANGAVSFHAVWELASVGDNRGLVARGDFHPTDLHWTPRNEATLAAALSRAVAGLAADIAGRVPKT